VVEIWYALLVLAFIAFAVTEGRNFGIGILLHRVAKSRAERRLVRDAVGPLWSWHEVWLIAAFGTLFLAFPKVLATALSGYYLAVFLLVWCAVLRGIALEFGGHFDNALWQTFWDGVFATGSTLLAVFFGAAFGNILRGVPLDAGGRMFLPLFTDFTARGRVGILDWYTGAVALFTLVLLAAHGATYLASRTTGAILERSRRTARRAWIVVLVLLPLVSMATRAVRPDFFDGLLRHPAAWPALLATAGGLGAVFLGLRAGMETMAFTGSSWCIAGMMGGAAASIFPVMLRSTLAPQYSMSAYGSAAGSYGLGVALAWWPVAIALSLWYAWTIGKRYRGRASEADG
jgi:cytochrome d ubiquinol oxidase subunit II